jgi:hypothetical protein
MAGGYMAGSVLAARKIRATAEILFPAAIIKTVRRAEAPEK